MSSQEDNNNNTKTTTTTTTPAGSTSSSSSSDLSIGFIGAGMMASAIMDGLLSKKVIFDPSNICCSDKYATSALEKARSKGIRTYKTNMDVLFNAQDVIIIAVKPNVVIDVCRDIKKATIMKNDMKKKKNDDDDDKKSPPQQQQQQRPPSPVIMSVAAGVTLQTLQDHLPEFSRVIRIMPNTPCLIGEGATAYTMGNHTIPTIDRTLVHTIFGSVSGIVIELNDECLLNAVTGLSGSGPAYVYEFIEALSDGGVRCGLSRQTSIILAAQTVKGAADMILLQEKNQNQTTTTEHYHPAILKDRVTSPGGTTIAGCDELEKGGFRSIAIQAVKAATRRSMQLGGISEEDIIHKYNL